MTLELAIKEILNYKTNNKTIKQNISDISLIKSILEDYCNDVASKKDASDYVWILYKKNILYSLYFASDKVFEANVLSKQLNGVSRELCVKMINVTLAAIGVNHRLNFEKKENSPKHKKNSAFNKKELTNNGERSIPKNIGPIIQTKQLNNISPKTQIFSPNVNKPKAKKKKTSKKHNSNPKNSRQFMSEYESYEIIAFISSGYILLAINFILHIIISAYQPCSFYVNLLAILISAFCIIKTIYLESKGLVLFSLSLFIVAIILLIIQIDIQYQVWLIIFTILWFIFEIFIISFILIKISNNDDIYKFTNYYFRENKFKVRNMLLIFPLFALPFSIIGYFLFLDYYINILLIEVPIIIGSILSSIYYLKMGVDRKILDHDDFFKIKYIAVKREYSKYKIYPKARWFVVLSIFVEFIMFATFINLFFLKFLDEYLLWFIGVLEFLIITFMIAMIYKKLEYLT